VNSINIKLDNYYYKIITNKTCVKMLLISSVVTKALVVATEANTETAGFEAEAAASL